VLAAGVPAAAGDWPLVRHDGSACGVADEPLTAPLQLLWTYESPGSGFEATAAIVGGVVYAGDLDGTFHAVRLADGQPVWTRKYPGEVRLSESKPVWSPQAAPGGFVAGSAVVDGRVFCVDFNGAVRCLEAATGDLLWQLGCESPLYAAPNVHEGRVLVVTDGGELLALDAKNGDVRWRFAIDQPLRCWPTVVAGRALVAGCDGNLHAVDVATGKGVASLPIAGPADAIPAVKNGRLFFCTAPGVFHCLEVDPLAEAWRYAHQGQGEDIHAAAVTDELAIFGTHRKEVVALEAASGKERWTFPVRSRVEGSPAVAGDLVVFGTNRGRLHAVSLAAGEELWQENLGGKFTASPAVADGKLVIGNEDGKLYCFGSSPR
jgi:outer membrane protein assembly factor BamB